MADLQQSFAKYKYQYKHAPNATQLAKFAGVKYSEASSFLRNDSSSTRNNVTPLTYSNTNKGKDKININSSPNMQQKSATKLSSLHNNSNKHELQQSSAGLNIASLPVNNPWRRLMEKQPSSNEICKPKDSDFRISQSATLKESSARLIACNGDCGSKLSICINHCVNSTVM